MMKLNINYVKVLTCMYFSLCILRDVKSRAFNQEMSTSWNAGLRRNAPLALSRLKRSEEHIVKDCIFVTSEEGQYFYKTVTRDHNAVCGVYILTDPDKNVQVQFDFLNVPCETDSLVSFVDGWELNGQFFPSVEDHPKPFEQRYSEFCGALKLKQVFESSQNAALVQYRIPNRGNGFSFVVRFVKNPTPCNILLEGAHDIYTLRNYGKHINCSLTTFHPAQFKVLSLGVGRVHRKRNMQLETGTIHKCEKRGIHDFVQLGGGDDLDLNKLAVVDSICGTDSVPEEVVETIFCGVTTVRLVSSGEYDNTVTLAVRQANENDIPSASLVCGL